MTTHIVSDNPKKEYAGAGATYAGVVKGAGEEYVFGTLFIIIKIYILKFYYKYVFDFILFFMFVAIKPFCY
jgi:hypothetical protein